MLTTPSSKIAFVASGGGLKAYAFHAGVLRALEEAGVERVRAGQMVPPPESRTKPMISSYIGSSAGACISAACVFFDSLDEAEGVIGLKDTGMERFTRRVMYPPATRAFLQGKFGGLVSADAIEGYFSRRAGARNDFRTLGPELYVCATELNSSRKIIFGPRDSSVNGQLNPYVGYRHDAKISQAIAASVSIPGVYQPYRIYDPLSRRDIEYIDGEVRETLSVHVARDTEVDFVILSNTWIPYHYGDEHGSVSKRGVRGVLQQTVTQIIEQKVDRIRRELDIHREVVTTTRAWAKRHGVAPAVEEDLIATICDAMRFRSMEQIYIAPRRTDADFILAPMHSFDRSLLARARDLGYMRAREAIAGYIRRNTLPVPERRSRSTIPPWVPSLIPPEESHKA